MKKTIMGIIAVCVAAALLFGGLTGVWIRYNTERARDAAAEFSRLLTEGKLTEAQARYYAAEDEAESLPGGEGQAMVEESDRVELAQIFGADLVTAGRGDETNSQDQLMAAVMARSQLQISAGPAVGRSAKAHLTLTGPDMEAWFAGLTDEQRYSLFLAEDVGAAVTELLGQTAAPEQTVEFDIPMVKNGIDWRFQVTQEMEEALFGSILE